MKIRLFVALSTLLVLAACDGPAPQVDPHNPVVDGQRMTQAEYLNKYCANRANDPMCIAVHKAMLADATKPNQPKGW